MSANKVDYYTLLEVSRDAEGDELKRAYRKMAVKYHPDQNPDDPQAENQFKAVSEAYSVLSDPAKRRRYDAMGHAAFDQAGGGTGFDASDFGSLGDLLEGLLDDVLGRKGPGGPPKDLKYNLTISFEEAALGAEKMIEYARQVQCGTCGGEGSASDAVNAACPACSGRGAVRFQRGLFSAARPCSACEGTGVRPGARCQTCHGSGTETKTQELKVRLPPGIEDGAVRTVRGMGTESPQGTSHLHVHVQIETHPLFTRKGADLLCEVPVSFPQAALGAQLEVPTLEGRVTMKLPAGTQSGKLFRLRGKGLPVFGGYGKGDQLVSVLVEVPSALTERQTELLQELANEMGSETHPRQSSFLDKLKNLF